MRKLVAGSLLAVVVSYRAYLWLLSNSLEARGEREDALFVIFSDPLRRVELALAGRFAPHGPLVVVHLLCLALWLTVWAGLVLVVAWQGHRRAVSRGVGGH